MQIRRANLTDIKALNELLYEYLSNCKTHFPMPDEKAVAWTIHSSFHHTSPILLNLAYSDNGELIGASCVVASRYLWAMRMQAQLVLIYVKPEYRGGSAFIRLMREVESWAKEKECDEISLTLSTGNDDEKTADLLGRIGYVRTGIDTVKPL